ncbi:MAG: hypothetical protein LC126_11085 [Bryobacterales bacterium]|nr:hypothetical protein [Bryobacterales bacterium]
MPRLSSLEGVLWAVNIGFTLLLAARLWISGLSAIYRAFQCFLLFSFLRGCIPAILPMTRSQYGNFYAFTEIASLIFYFLVTLEIYARVFQKFPGIESFSRWALSGFLAVSMVLAMVTLYPDVASRPNPTPLDYLLIIERGVLSGLVFLILMMSLFLSWYPVVLARNIVIHSLLFAVYFTTKAGVFLLQNMAPDHIMMIRTVNLAVFTLGNICMLLWMILLRRQGEKTEVKVGYRWDQEEEERLIGQLRRINSTLSRPHRD